MRHEIRAFQPGFFLSAMNILLAYISGASDRRDPYLNLLPTGLCSLHACLREAGFEAFLANFSGCSDAVIMEHLAGLKPEIIGISQWTHNRHASLEFATLVREQLPSSMIVMGGGHATFSYGDNLTDRSPLDCVILGEGEDTLLELAGHIADGTAWQDIRGIACRCDGQIVVTPPRPPLENLDRLPYAVSNLEHSFGVDLQLQPEFILTTRGCPSNCHFCSSPGFWGRKVRFRSPESIVNEILYVRERFGLIYFSLRDDTFTVDRHRTIEFCRLLIERRVSILWNCQSRVTALDDEVLTWMKRAGCECIQLGVESGSPRILAQLGKTITARQVEIAAEKIKNVGIGLSVFLISDIPGEVEEDYQKTCELIQNIRPDDGYVSPLAYYPGTHLFEDAVQQGRVARDVFERHADAAVYASAHTGQNTRRLLNQLAAQQEPGSARRFQRQKQLLGFCYTTNVLAGEWYRQSGEYRAAEAEFREIINREPENPWGWFLLAELYREQGRHAAARDHYLAVSKIVPKHQPTLDALNRSSKKKRGL